MDQEPRATPSAPLPFSARDERPGLLVIGDGLYPRDFAAVGDAAGLRLLDIVPVAHAAERLDRQIGGEGILLFCERPDPLLERLLVQAETIAIQNGMTLIVVAGLDCLDMAYACLRDEATQLLCGPDPADLAGALIAATRRDGARPTLHDVGRESEGLRLQQLSEEVGRIARTLDALTHGRAPALPSFPAAPRMSDKASDYIGMPALPPMGAAPRTAALSAQTVRDLIRARRLRADLLPGDLFADPAWDMLLDLLAAKLEHERVSVSSLCIASAVPPTTALRWIRTLTDRGLVLRQADPHDGRRVFIALADAAEDALTRWFGASRRFLCG